MLKSSSFFKDTLEYNYFLENLGFLSEKELISAELAEKIVEIFKTTQKRIHSFTLAINFVNYDELTLSLKEQILKLGQTCITARIFRRKIFNKESRYFPSTQKIVKAYLRAASKAEFSWYLKVVSIPNKSLDSLLEMFSALSPCINGVYSTQKAFEMEYSKEPENFHDRGVQKLEVIFEEDIEIDDLAAQTEKLVEHEICRSKTLARKPLLIRSNAASGSELVDRLKAYPDNPRIVSFVNMFLYPYLKGTKNRQGEILEELLKEQFPSFFEKANLRAQLMSAAVNTYIRRAVIWFYETRSWKRFEIYTQANTPSSVVNPAIGNVSSESTEEDNQQDLEYNWFVEWLGAGTNVSYSSVFISFVYAVHPYLSLDLPSHDFTPVEIIEKIIQKMQIVRAERRKTIQAPPCIQKVERQIPKERPKNHVREGIKILVSKLWDLNDSIYMDSDKNFAESKEDLYLWFDTFNGESKSRVTLTRPFTPEFLSLLKRIIEKMSCSLPKSLSCAALIQHTLEAIKELHKNRQLV